jgi:hypothetical protein
MESNEQKSLRQKILAIQKDTSLTPQQKSRAIQQLMMGNFQNQTTPEEKKIELDLSVTYHNEKDNVYGCTHYIKNCKIKAPCCNQMFTCRRCHDEAITDHKINRYLIEVMMCFFCKQLQPISNECTNCHKTMAFYFCGVCKFFDGNELKNIWHCDKCGMCRVSKEKNSHEHCDQCHTCMIIGHQNHTDRVLDCNCPICGENMFTSTIPSCFPEPCQHAIHAKCLNQYFRSGRYSCPICSKTYSDVDMSPVWREIDRAIELQPVPEEYKEWKVEILCNDCNVKEITAFHFIGNKCSKCQGYNTNIITTIRPEDNENPDQQQQQQQQ